MMLFHDSLFTVLAVKRAHLGGLDRQEKEKKRMTQRKDEEGRMPPLSVKDNWFCTEYAF